MVDQLLGIDLGTTSTKLALIGRDHGPAVTASRPSTLHTPGPARAESDLDEWWDNVGSLVPEVLAVAGAEPSDLAAVACSGMVPAVVTLGADGPNRRAILQNDARAVTEIEELAEELAELDLVTLTGSPLSQQSVAPTLRWLARHEPSSWGTTASVCGSYDWLARALGAESHVETNWAIESGLFDLDGEPIAAVLDAAGVEPELIPPVRPPGTVVGCVGRAAAAATGIPAGVPIVVGGADHVLSAYAAGLTEPGDLLVKLGGAGDILLVSDTALTDRRLYLDAHPAPGRWLPNGCMATSGSLIRWFQSIAGGDLAELDAEARVADHAGAVLCLPYFLGEKSPLHDPRLRGAFLGLSLEHDRGAMFRAVLEAIAFGFRHHLEIFDELGCAPTRVFVSNGGSRSTVWKQILADVLGLPLIPVTDHPGASLGAAMVAEVGIGRASFDAGPTRISYADPIEPDPAAIVRYDDLYPVWRAAGEALRPTSHSLADRERT